MYYSQVFFFQPKRYLELEERAVDCSDDIGVEQFVYDQNNSERSSWKLCSCTKLPKSEVIFFQVVILLLLIISSLAKLLFDQIPCEEMPAWVSHVSCGWLYPSQPTCMNKLIFPSHRLFMSLVGPGGSGWTRFIFAILASPTTFYLKLQSTYYFYQEYQSFFQGMAEK